MGAIALTHAHVTALPNDPTKDVSATAWNAGHTVPQTGTGTNVVSDLAPTVFQPVNKDGLFVTKNDLSASWYVFVDPADSILKAESPTSTVYQLTPRTVLTGGTTIHVPADYPTLTAALLYASTIDFGGFRLTIQLAAGTYSGNFVIPVTVGQSANDQLVIQGDLATPSNVVLTSTADFNATLFAGAGARCQVQGVQFTGSDGNQFAIDANTFGVIQFQTCDFGANLFYHVLMGTLGFAYAVGNYSISGSAASHIACFGGAGVFTGLTVTLTGTPNFSINFAYAVDCGNLSLDGMSFVGGATGTRYLAEVNGVINTAGGGANYLPGNGAGSTATGGQYT